MERSAVISLTTDFGSGSSYVGSLRGALLSISPRIVLADISHDVRPFQVMEGALLLRDATRWYPRGTVHLAVVDPGVGGSRRAIALHSGDYTFVGPDNGLFTPFLDGAQVYEIEPDLVTRGPVSPTFHGRDLFAPAAGRLALGDPLRSIGHQIDDPVRLDWPQPVIESARVTGVILHIDSFGNLITNIDESHLGGRVPRQVRVGPERATTFARTYADVAEGTLLALFGSGGLLEVAVNRGSAADSTGAAAGHPVEVLF